MLHVEYTLEDPIVEPSLAELVAVEDRPRPLPPFLEEVDQRFVRLLAGEAIEAMQDPRGAVDAESTLAWSHREAQQAADVVKVGGGAAPDRLLELPARDELAVTDQLLVGEVVLLALESLSELVGLVVL